MDYVAARNLIGPFEGNIEHMYLDTNGFVTVGIGNMLPDAATACALGFVDRTTMNRATAEQIKADFDSVRKQTEGMKASSYRSNTKLDLPNVEIDSLFRKRVDEFVKQLEDQYSKYSSYPDSAQLAMMDMAFNLGAAALKNKWPKLNAAIETEDWEAASNECQRPSANAIRNAATKALFKKAGAEVEASKKVANPKQK